MEPCDLPAAHSMDTTWFAVDEDGHVAVLETGEAGALPEAWEGGQGGGNAALDAIHAAGFPVVMPEELLLEPSGRLWWRDDDLALRDSPRPDQHYDLLVRLAHPRVASLIPGAAVLPVEGSVWFAAVSGPVPDSLLTALLRRGLIECGWSWFGQPAHLFGLYDYGHGQRWENTVSGPYVRQGVPERPLKLRSLPMRLREMAVHLPGIRFSEEQALQPVEILPCRSHQSSWVGLDGVRHEFER